MLVSCHFGDPDEIMPTYSKTIRNITFQFDVASDFGGSDLALFCPVLIGESDTIKTIDKNDKVTVSYTRKPAGVGRLRYGVSDGFNYKARLQAIMANGSHVPGTLFYPYSRVRTLPADSSYFIIDFSEQDGTLATIREKAYYAMANIEMECDEYSNKGIVRSSVTPVKLSPKHALLRLSLVSPDGRMSLANYLRQRGMAYGAAYSITRIQVADFNSKGNFGTPMMLDVDSGITSFPDRFVRYIDLHERDDHNMIGYQTFEVPESSSAQASVEGASWGTSCYVALPCLGDSACSRHSLSIRVTASVANSTYVLYGRLEPDFLYHEGESYCTAPVQLSLDEGSVNGSASVYHADQSFEK